jgi:hypothetical protein
MVDEVEGAVGQEGGDYEPESTGCRYLFSV